MKTSFAATVLLVSLMAVADDYDLKTLVEPVSFSCELRDVRLTRVIDKISSGSSFVNRQTQASSDKGTYSADTRLSTESTTSNSNANHNEDGYRSGTQFNIGGGLKWGFIPSGKVGGEYSRNGFHESRKTTDQTALSKGGSLSAQSIVNELITAKGHDTTSEETEVSHLGGYRLDFSVTLRNMDAKDRLKVEGTRMRAQLHSDELPGTIIAEYKEREDFWLGAEETVCGFTYRIEDLNMLRALLKLDRAGRLGQLKLTRSGADIVVISERTGRNVLSDLNAAESHSPGTRFSVEFGELKALPDWRVSYRHSSKSGPRGNKVTLHEALLGIQDKAIEQSETLPTNVFTFAADGSLAKVVDRPLLDRDGEGRYRMFALRLTTSNGSTKLCLPNSEIMKAEIANYAKVALFDYSIEEFVNVLFGNPEYFARLKDEVEKCLGDCGDKSALDVYKQLVEKRAHEEDARPLPEDMSTITPADVKRFMERAQAGVPEMKFKYAWCLIAGTGVTRNQEEGVKRLQEAAEQGCAEAQLYMGGICQEGAFGVATNKGEAVKWYRKAAEKGHAGAQLELGRAYAVGEGVAKDMSLAVKWYSKAAEQGLAEAQFYLGILYAAGEGVPKNDVEAVKLYRKAAEQGFAKAQFRLGKAYAFGEGLSKDEFEAVKWWRKAAEQGLAEAQISLGECYLSGEGVSKDMFEAVKWYRRAAEQGHAEAQFIVGECYASGTGVAKDMFEAAKWYRKAAEQGFAKAQTNLGLCYAGGIGVTKNEAEAVRWVSKAVEQGNAESQFWLGEFYSEGVGVARNALEAVKWYRRAAEQGLAEAQLRLGQCYRTGAGVPRDEEKAAE